MQSQALRAERDRLQAALGDAGRAVDEAFAPWTLPLLWTRPDPFAQRAVLSDAVSPGIRPDLVAGTSMGAIVGGLYAQDPTPDRVWRRLLEYVENPDFANPFE